MGGYLDNYGAGEERRERFLKRALLVLALVLIIGLVLYFLFRDYREEQVSKRFFALLEQKDYAAAYRLWGCSVEQPCKDYNYERFLEDWGPNSPHADVSRRKLDRKRSCSGGVIQVWRWTPDDEVLLWINRSDQTLSFAPWPVCSPHFRLSPPPSP